MRSPSSGALSMAMQMPARKRGEPALPTRGLAIGVAALVDRRLQPIEALRRE